MSKKYTYILKGVAALEIVKRLSFFSLLIIFLPTFAQTYSII